KRYGDYLALDRVDLRVRAGALFGFLGPNGAGKTTTIRILLGLLHADDGVARVLGGDARRDGAKLRAEIGYLPGDVRFYDGLTGRQTLQFFAAARRRDCGGEIRRLARLFDLDLDRRVRDYSRGMKQKLGLIQALMHRPRLLVLDEPTASLDPLIREALYAELRAVALEGRTVVFSSHTLSEVEQLCDEVAILRRGKLIEQERVAVMQQRGVRRVEIVFADAIPTTLPDALNVSQRHKRKLTGSWRGATPALLEWLSSQAVSDVVITPPDLEDLFMAYYNDEASEPAA
ncbi:MAG: ABC transporter ATP-binding protein, partial [Planctomycetota bacterium]